MKLPERATPEQRVKKIEGVIRELQADDRPILVGPFRSEPGFESSYWIPFLQMLARHVPKFRERSTIITRGGAGVLYQNISENAVELYQMRSPEEVRVENRADSIRTKELKQNNMTDWDRKVVSDIRNDMNLHESHLLHPSLMYWGLRPYFNGTAGFAFVQQLLDFTLCQKVKLPEGVQLPPTYVAMRWYDRHTFPVEHPDTQDWIAHITKVCASRLPVIILANESHLDDHFDQVVKGDNIYIVSTNSPHDSLAVQASVISNATCFVGTYGGTAQTALRLGTPSASFWHTFGGTSPAHLALQHLISTATGVPFIATGLQETHIMRHILAPKRTTDVHPDENRVDWLVAGTSSGVGAGADARPVPDADPAVSGVDTPHAADSPADHASDRHRGLGDPVSVGEVV